MSEKRQSLHEKLVLIILAGVMVYIYCKIVFFV